MEASPQVLAAVFSKVGPKLQQLKSWELTSLLSYLHKTQAAELEVSQSTLHADTDSTIPSNSSSSWKWASSSSSSAAGSSRTSGRYRFDHAEAEALKEAAAPLVVRKLRGVRQGYDEWAASWKMLAELAEVYSSPWTHQEVKMHVLTPLIHTAEKLLESGQGKRGYGEGQGGDSQGVGGKGWFKGQGGAVSESGGLDESGVKHQPGRNVRIYAPIPLSTAAGFIAALANGPKCERLLGQLADYVNTQLQQRLQLAEAAALSSFRSDKLFTSRGSSSSNRYAASGPWHIPGSETAAAAAAVPAGEATSTAAAAGRPGGTSRNPGALLPHLAELQQLVRVLYQSDRLPADHPLYQTVAAAATLILQSPQSMTMTDLKSTVTLLYYYSLGLQPPPRFLTAVAEKLSTAVAAGVMPAADVCFAVRTHLAASASVLGPYWEDQQEQQQHHHQQQQQLHRQVGAASTAAAAAAYGKGGGGGTKLPKSLEALKAANAGFAVEVARCILAPTSPYAIGKLVMHSGAGGHAHSSSSGSSYSGAHSSSSTSSSRSSSYSGPDSSSSSGSGSPFSLLASKAVSSLEPPNKQWSQGGAAAASRGAEADVAGTKEPAATAERDAEMGLGIEQSGGAVAEAANILYQLSQLGLEELELCVPLLKQVLLLAAGAAQPSGFSKEATCSLSTSEGVGSRKGDGVFEESQGGGVGSKGLLEGGKFEEARVEGRGGDCGALMGLEELPLAAAVQLLQVLQRAAWVKLYHELDASKAAQQRRWMNAAADGAAGVTAAAGAEDSEEEPVAAELGERSVAARVAELTSAGRRWEGFHPLFSQWVHRDPKEHEEQQLQWQQQRLQEGKQLEHIWVPAGDVELLLRASFQLVDVLGGYFNGKWDSLPGEQKQVVLKLLLEASERQKQICRKVVRRERRVNRERVAELGGAGVVGWGGGMVAHNGSSQVPGEAFGDNESLVEEMSISSSSSLVRLGSMGSAGVEYVGAGLERGAEGVSDDLPTSDGVAVGMVISEGVRNKEENAKNLRRLMAIM